MLDQTIDLILIPDCIRNGNQVSEQGAVIVTKLPKYQIAIVYASSERSRELEDQVSLEAGDSLSIDASLK